MLRVLRTVAAGLLATASISAVGPSAYAAKIDADAQTNRPLTNIGYHASPSTATNLQASASGAAPDTKTKLGGVQQLTADKTIAKVGETIWFTLVVENNNNPLFDIGFHVRVRLPTPGFTCDPSHPLSWHERSTCRWSYVVQPWDSMQGQIYQEVQVEGQDWMGVHYGMGGGSLMIPITGNPNLEFTASASPDRGLLERDIVTYTYTTKNTGDVGIRNVAVRSGLPGDPALTCTPKYGDLMPGNQRVCTTQTTITAADVDAGSMVDHAEAKAWAVGASITRTADVTVHTGEHPSLDVTVVPDPATNLALGQTINWTMYGHNTGDAELTHADQQMPMPGLVNVACTGGPTLAPDQGILCNGSSVVTQADVDAGSVTNTVTINGTDRRQHVIHASASGTATVARRSEIALTKTASPASGVRAGDTITYDYIASNTGSVTLHDVGIFDGHRGLTGMDCDHTTPATIGPGAAQHCTATYVATQADVDAGSIIDTARTTSRDPQDRLTDASASATVTTDTAAALSLTKTAAPSADVAVGTNVTYTFTGTNTGSVSLHAVTVTDPMPGLPTPACSPTAAATLTPGATITCHATYAVTQANVDAGSFANTATIHGLDPRNNPASSSATATVTASSKAHVTFTKSGTATPPVVNASDLSYTFVATNDGDRTVRSATITDPMPGLSPLACTPANGSDLAPTASLRCTATAAATQIGIDAGTIANTATLNATVTGLPPIVEQATASIATDQTTTIALSKTASPSTNVRPGDTITYTLHATNTGAVTLHNAVITDPMPALSPLTCTPAAPATLAPGATLDCTATYIATQVDADAGTITNTATIAGTRAGGDPANAAATAHATATVHTDPTAILTLTKTASPTAGVRVGDEITYDYVATNAGVVTLHSVTIADPHPDLSALRCDQPTPATLAPTAALHCTATYRATQADVDAGSIVDTATATSLDPVNLPHPATASATVATDTTAALALTKTATPAADAVAGTKITYRFEGTNTGAVSLHGVTVTDPMPGLPAPVCSPAAPATLAAGATISCTADYVVTQADVDAGSFTNTATIGGLDPRNNPVTTTATATVTASSKAHVTFTKSVTATTPVAAGSRLDYTFHAVNDGHRTAHGVTITDPMPGLSELDCTQANGTDLEPEAGLRCTAHTIATQAQIDSGRIENTAVLTATVAGLPPVLEQARAHIDTDQSTSIELTKTATPNKDVKPGDTVTYQFHATNAGTVTLHNVVIADPMPGLSAPECATAMTATLAPNESLDCTATYVVTQADADTGNIENAATATAQNPRNEPATAHASATVNTDDTATLALTKSASPQNDLVAGDVVAYTMTGTNTGSVTLRDVSVTDEMPSMSTPTCHPAAPASLAAGAGILCQATYTVTQDDVDHDRPIVNHATIKGTSPAGHDVDATATASVTTLQHAALTVTKTANPSADVVLGQRIDYAIDVTNSGTLTVHDITVDDPMAGLSHISCEPEAKFTLAPSATAHCTAHYTVTQADIDAGAFLNTATAQGATPSDHPVRATGGTAVATNQLTDISITKVAHAAEPAALGSTLTYDVHASNTGTVTLHDVTVTDALPGLADWSCTPAGPATLAPGATITCTAAYTVSQADIDAAQVSNTAAVAATGPDGTVVARSDTADTVTNSAPGLSLTKSATPTTGVDAGAPVTYTFVATNSGTTNLHQVTIIDPMPGLSPLTCTPPAGSSLAPGAVMTCTATYVTTEADAAAGKIHNTATATALDPHEHAVAATASEMILAGETASMDITETPTPATDAVVGDHVHFATTITNSGTVALHHLELDQTLSGLDPTGCAAILAGELETGAIRTCNGTHTVTQAEVDAGSFTNTAVIAALDPFDHPVRAIAHVTVTTSAPAPIPTPIPHPNSTNGSGTDSGDSGGNNSGRGSGSHRGSATNATSGTVVETTPADTAGANSNSTDVAENRAARIRSLRESAAANGSRTDGFSLSNPLVRVLAIVVIAALGIWWWFIVAARRRRDEDETEVSEASGEFTHASRETDS